MPVIVRDREGNVKEERRGGKVIIKDRQGNMKEVRQKGGASALPEPVGEEPREPQDDDTDEFEAVPTPTKKASKKKSAKKKAT